MTGAPAAPLPDLGLGVLSWRGYASLDAMLDALNRHGLPTLAGERLVFLPEEEEQGHRIAARHGFASRGHAENLGIHGGFRALAGVLEARYVLLLENDLHATEPLAEAGRQLAHGLRLLREGRAHVVQFRDLDRPGQAFQGIPKYRAYHPAPDAPWPARATAALRRTVRPAKAERMIGNAPFAEAAPERRFPQAVTRDAEGFFLMSSRHRVWSNQSILVERRFFLDHLLEYVERAPTTRRVNGFKNIEIELNGAWWREQDLQVAVAPGFLTHERIGDRGY